MLCIERYCVLKKHVVNYPHDSGPLQWARGNCAPKHSVAARPCEYLTRMNRSYHRIHHHELDLWISTCVCHDSFTRVTHFGSRGNDFFEQVHSSVCMNHIIISYICLSHVTLSHVTHTNESRHTNARVLTHICTSHVTHMHESCHTYE